MSAWSGRARHERELSSIPWFERLGLAVPPDERTSPPGGLVMYRAWGGSSGEWGSGFFSLEKPESVLDAELRSNIADWGNAIRFVSTFRLKEGFRYLKGPVLHVGDGAERTAVWHYSAGREGTQIYVGSPLLIKVEKLGSFESLKQDRTVITRPKPSRDLGWK